MFPRTTLAFALVASLGLTTATTSFAREGAEGPRGEGPGHKLIDTRYIVAREGAEGPRGEGPGHKLIDSRDIVAREGAEGSRGEGPGHKLV